jgi:hypothetical protein
VFLSPLSLYHPPPRRNLGVEIFKGVAHTVAKRGSLEITKWILDQDNEIQEREGGRGGRRESVMGGCRGGGGKGRHLEILQWAKEKGLLHSLEFSTPCQNLEILKILKNAGCCITMSKQVKTP